MKWNWCINALTGKSTWQETTEDSSADTPATAQASGTGAAMLTDLDIPLKQAEPTSTESGKTETANKQNVSESEIKIHQILGQMPPYDHYYSIDHSNITITENQSINCLTLTQSDDDERQIHICDVPGFIATLMRFQIKRKEDPRYK